MIKLTVEQYEYLITKVNQLTHLIDRTKLEFKDDKSLNERVLLMEKTLMELEARIANAVQRH